MTDETPERDGSQGDDLRAEIERLQHLLDDETEAERDLARLELEYTSVHQALADARTRLSEAKADLARIVAEAADVAAEQVSLTARVEDAQSEDTARLDAALAELMRLSQGRYLAEAEVAAARSEVEALREEHAGQEALVAELATEVARARARRLTLERERRQVEASLAEETARLGEALNRLGALEERRDAQRATLAEAAAVIDGVDLAEVDLDGVDLDRVDRDGVEPGPGARTPVLVGASEPWWNRSTATWNAAFALFAVLVVLLGAKTLVDDASATEAFCAEAPVLDVVAARSALDALAGGARPGDAFSTFEQGRYAYPTSSQVSAPVREAAAALESAHAAVAERKGRPTSSAQYRELSQAVVDADARLRSACRPE